ncbi:protein kinase [Streptomyces sp. NPDC059003]|uniref:protein kinase domain-containing protein n=1 Tax=Streptomyces sp. NPDC059003 TaxID=3346691 RepID=UPI0036C12E0B
MIGQLRDSSPRRLGPYETLARLGAGGMGEVFLAGPHGTAGAYDPGDLVAVKAIRGDVAGEPAFRTRFRREIAVATAVTSPHVARLVAGDADAEQPWLATEYVAGPTLAEAVRAGGPLPADAVAALGTALARALAAVHAAGALHRDLKPANVLLGADGPKLIDFGVARSQGATTVTSTGLLVGTPGFMSPEHIAGGRHVVAASDVFCLASVLAYAASGRDPFGDGPVAAVLYRVTRAEADLDAVPEELREVLADCLAQDPAARPAPETLADRLAAPAADAGFPWPDAVAELIRDVERDVAQVCAAGGPLLPQTNQPVRRLRTSREAAMEGERGEAPSEARAEAPHEAPDAGGAAPPLDVHALPTLGATSAPTPAPAPPRARRAHRAHRGRILAALVAVAVVGGVVGGLLALRGGDGGGDDGGGASGGGARRPGSSGKGPESPLSKAELTALAGVDERGGADRSGAVPQVAAQRPDGWKPWRGRFGHTPMDCAADTEAIVCLLTNGTYEALSAADGHRLWRADGRGADDGEVGDEAYISPSGGFFMPGDQLKPQLRGGTAVIAHKGRLQARDSRTGKVKWEAEPERGAFTGVPLLHDDMVIATDQHPLYDDGQPGVSVRAFSLKGGKPRWSTPIVSEELSKAEDGAYTAQLVRNGLVYATTRGAAVALDVRTGAERARNDQLPGNGCRTLMTRGGATPGTSAERAVAPVLCVASVDAASDLDSPTSEPQLRVSRLDPRTLKETGGFGIEATQEQSSGMQVSAVGPKAAVVQSRDTRAVLVADPANGKVIRKAKQGSASGRAHQGGSVERLVSTGPLLVDGDRALYADNSRLVSLPLTAGGTERATRVPGAPGDRTEPAPDSQDLGMVVADVLQPPVLLALGGVAHIVYDQGTVVSVPVPSGS